MPPMPQDHPPWKRGQAGLGCFTPCFLWGHCFCSLPVSACSAFWKGSKGKKRSLLTWQEGTLTWLIFQPVPGQITKHCHQELEFMIMIPGLACRMNLNWQLACNQRETTRALFMLLWTIVLLEGIQDRKTTCRRHPQNMHPFVWEVKPATEPGSLHCMSTCQYLCLDLQFQKTFNLESFN